MAIYSSLADLLTSVPHSSVGGDKGRIVWVEMGSCKVLTAKLYCSLFVGALALGAWAWRLDVASCVACFIWRDCNDAILTDQWLVAWNFSGPKSYV